MIRRDYLLRMIEEFLEFLARMESYKRGKLWDEAEVALDAECRRLMGADMATILKLSETELLAKVVDGESTQLVRQKTLIVTTLFKEAGDVAVAQSRDEEGRACYIKGLHLLLEVSNREEPDEAPEFVPKVEVFVAALQGEPIPVPTRALLMQHYEGTGQFGKAEDALYAVLDALPDSADTLDFGIGFYQRVAGHSDDALEVGNLPRAEVNAGLSELRERRQAVQ
jgi:Family of unknown function (DUF6483)